MKTKTSEKIWPLPLQAAYYKGLQRLAHGCCGVLVFVFVGITPALAQSPLEQAAQTTNEDNVAKMWNESSPFTGNGFASCGSGDKVVPEWFFPKDVDLGEITSAEIFELNDVGEEILRAVFDVKSRTLKIIQ